MLKVLEGGDYDGLCYGGGFCLEGVFFLFCEIEICFFFCYWIEKGSFFFVVYKYWKMGCLLMFLKCFLKY